MMLGRYLLFGKKQTPKIPNFPDIDTGNGKDHVDVLPGSLDPDYGYDSPVDFETLRKTNSDIYAWLVIPGSEISQPVLQRVGDDDYYLDHGPDGQQSDDGALYTQASRNRFDFSDKCTVIYGHKMNSGAMFGTLQIFFSDPDNFSRYNEVVIYTPDREIRYKVFAAVPYDNRHILMSFDFSSEWGYMSFIDSLYSSRSLGANLDEAMEFDYNNNILILSTCLRGNLNKRYLVCAVEVKEPSDSIT